MAEGIALDEYVKETLLGIVRAVIAAQDDGQCGGFIGRAAHGEAQRDESRNAVTEVTFDLATTVEDKGSGGGSAGIKVIPFLKAEVNGQVESRQSTVSRIAFSVPIAVPRPKAQRAEDAARAEEARQRGQRDSALMRGLGDRLA